MSFKQTLDQLLARHEEVGHKLSQGVDDSKEFVKLSKEYAELDEVAIAIRSLREAEKELQDTQEMLKDPEMREMAEQEVATLKKLIPELEQKIQFSLLPKDVDDERNAILEIRAGTGGDEAALFASNLLRMYQRFAENQGWRV